MNTQAKIEILQNGLSKLPAKDTDFAKSLCQQFTRRGSLSDKQMFWVDKLVAKVEAPMTSTVVRETLDVGDLSGVMKLFDKAKQHLKFPAIVLNVPNADVVRINVAGERARAPGSLNVCSYGKFNNDGRRVWYGRVHLDGRYETSAAAGTDGATIAARLREFGQDPARVASEHGRLTGRCCFCNLPLKDERSTAVGYGKICAQHWDLPWGERPVAFAETPRQEAARQVDTAELVV